MITQIRVVLEHSTRLLYVKTPTLFSNEKLLEISVCGHRFLCSNQCEPERVLHIMLNFSPFIIMPMLDPKAICSKSVTIMLHHPYVK